MQTRMQIISQAPETRDSLILFQSKYIKQTNTSNHVQQGREI